MAWGKNIQIQIAGGVSTQFEDLIKNPSKQNL